MNKECYEFFSNSFPIWDKLSEREMDLILRQSSLTEYTKGENVHGNTGKCTGAVFVKSGVLRTYILSDEGKEITLYRLYPGDVCMLAASCVMETITFDVFVDAEEKSEVCIINASALTELTTKNVFIENYVLKLTSERFSEVMWAMQQILFMSFDRRLAVFLLAEIEKVGGDTIHLTQEQIAKYMVSAREVVSRMLKYFSQEGLVEVSRGGVKILDREKLKVIAG